MKKDMVCKVSITIEYHSVSMVIVEENVSTKLHGEIVHFIAKKMANSKSFQSYGSKTKEVSKQIKRIERCLKVG